VIIGNYTDREMQTTSNYSAELCSISPQWKAELVHVNQESKSHPPGKLKPLRLWVSSGSGSSDLIKSMNELADFIESNHSLLVERQHKGYRGELLIRAEMCDSQLVLMPRILNHLAALSIAIKFQKGV
jgi:hypothetical protein